MPSKRQRNLWPLTPTRRRRLIISRRRNQPTRPQKADQ